MKTNYVLNGMRTFIFQFIIGISIICSTTLVNAQVEVNSKKVTANDDKNAKLRDDAEDFDFVKNLEIYYTMLKELRTYYVDQTDIGKIVKTSMDKMLETLDPYTVYYPESEIEDYRFLTTGEYGGIGAMVIKNGNNIVISEPYQDYPAYKAGLRAGDILLKIQDQSLEGKSIDDISRFLKGQPKTAIKLLISRPGTPQPFEKMVSRETIVIGNVPYFGMLNNEIGYIKLTGFTETASKEVKDALMELKEKNNAKSIVLDLRDNPGGLLIEAVNIVNLFVNKDQEIVSTKGKVKQYNRVFSAMNSAVDTKIPVVVLVNRGSASAAEIVSGAIQDLDRGVVIGQRTFGKGLVQMTRDLCYNSKLKITTSKYYIPSGRCIQALDYSHRNPDGSVGKVPDSLITQFTTLNGRKVYDGGGILPDIVLEAQKFSNISTALYVKNLLFDYVTNFRLQHDTIDIPEKYIISDADYENFINFLADKKVEYETESEKALDKLIEASKKEKYDDKVAAEFAALKKVLTHDKNKDLRLFKDEIVQLLSQEIVSRYYYQRGRIKSQLKFDSEVTKAISVLQKPNDMLTILKGGYKQN